MPTPKWWKDFYANERAELGEAHLERLVREALPPALERGGAIVFPHTRLSGSGLLSAAVAKAVVSGGYESVVALGVLHGQDRKNVSLRGIYTERDLVTADEFSLDSLEALIDVAADMFGVRPPLVIKRYPFLTEGETHSLRGYEELAQLVTDGAAVVATADLIHHGIGYETPAQEARDPALENTQTWARKSIAENLRLLAEHDYAAFDEHSKQLRSDFRDSGPLLASLLGTAWNANILDLRLIDYTDVLQAAAPTWVAAVLVAAWPRIG